MNAPSWDRVKQVFQEALDRPSHERAGCVRELCGTDQTLLAEVESLLATHEQAGSFAERPAIELLDGLSLGPASQRVASVGRVLQAGDRLGVYQIQSLVGAGGMGEVYKARDTRLDRTVAIKILPSADAELKARFEREAKAIASLQHPHICTLYDVGHQDGTDYLVMEFLDGETLATRLAKGLLPPDRVLKYAIEIADALDKAHRLGIVHRDLKPGNVMLTKTGAKLLDFGLAKTMERVGFARGPRVTGLPKSPASLTAKGIILGTLQYMAPEQLEDQAVDARTDIFALGTVIYEMATGKKAFVGDSQASLIAAILDATPPAISTLQPLTPSAIDHVVKICLAKDPDERWQTAGDVKRELAWIVEGGSQAGGAVPSATRRKALDRVTGMAVGLLVGAAVTGALVWSLPRSNPATLQSMTSAVIPLPPLQSIPVYAATIAISPDGTRVVYRADSATPGSHDGRLYLRALDQRTATPISGTEGAWNPFFSPDGQWVGFAVGNTLRKVSLSGGQPTTICELLGSASGSLGASWGPDNTIVFNTASSVGLSRVSAAGGIPRIVTIPDRGRREKTHRWPEILPGGKAVIFTVGTADIKSYDDARIEVVSLETGERRLLIEGGTYPRYAPTGHIIYARAGALYAVPFDVRRLETTGTAVRLLEGVATNVLEGGSAEFAFSQNGSLVYVPSGAMQFDRTLLWVDRHGKAQPITEQRRPIREFQLSPDGRRFAVGIPGANDEIWIHDLERDTFSRFAFGWNNDGPVWSPDGTRIAFTSDRGGAYNLFWELVDGSAPAERLTTSAHAQRASSWSPDGKVLAFTDTDPATGSDIWMLPMGGDRKPWPFLHEHFEETSPQFSPDGRWLAYGSTETGRSEIYMRPYPGPGGKWQISNDGGHLPKWARSGRELFYLNRDKLMSVTVTFAGMFRPAKPQVLIQPFPNFAYDVSPDGQRIATVTDESLAHLTQINLVLNWFEELKARVPTK